MTFYQVITFTAKNYFEEEANSVQKIAYYKTYEEAERFAIEQFYKDWQETLDGYMESKMWDYYLIGDLARQLNEWETVNSDDEPFKPVFIKYEPSSESEFPVITTCAFDEFDFVYKLYDYLWYRTYGLPNLLQDLKKLQTDESSMDCTLLGVKCHSALVKTRTKQSTIEELEKKLEEFKEKKEIVKHFFDWVYQDTDPLKAVREEEKKESLKSLFGKLEIDLGKNMENHGSFIQDLSLLSQNEESKDFQVELKEHENKNVFFHRFLLQARSKTYFSMFNTVETIPEKATDFSKRSPEFWKLFENYLYTGKIYWSKIYNQEQVIKELKDCNSFFQLNDNNGFSAYFKTMDSQIPIKRSKELNTDGYQPPKSQFFF
ncbi:pep-cterm sorting domain-containing protein [Anaeramoeba flamelloides]|uniref:Pep-cterm sorting domain-containing protein n=1 Tax=Anaeramoeba flamelloides TaxID=1746091 RepID=A0ABQ8Y794_9EUKA|nr:pep-cterm sorting domain-containing protein [Anaeramoeba flamelloides]